MEKKSESSRVVPLGKINMQEQMQKKIYIVLNVIALKAKHCGILVRMAISYVNSFRISVAEWFYCIVVCF